MTTKGEPRQLRCAIYTRKSSEEGLEQSFNSLDAQREACEAFIRSQKSEGWIALPALYDDGGISGGTMERPALVRLLADIQAGLVDTVVVYKVDRLTRSLGDFAKIVEVFDRAKVAFVSVTQQFNTTTSMGRLTLNMLLSFAQFEREVTGERIRDKIAASKKKGMWMGGSIPMGYRAHGRTLVIDPDEAAIVRQLFELYRDLGSVSRVKEEADRIGLRTPVRMSASGVPHGGLTFSRGHLYKLLGNPLYHGQIVHRDLRYPGQYEAIIDRELWQAVQELLARHAARPKGSVNTAEPSLLAVLLVDPDGRRLTPSHAVKGGRRYRYYVAASADDSSARTAIAGWRLPASEIETVVLTALGALLDSEMALLDLLQPESITPDIVSDLLERSKALATRLRQSKGSELVSLLPTVLHRVILDEGSARLEIETAAITGDPTSPRRSLTVPIALRHRGVETKLVIEGTNSGASARTADPALLKAVARGHVWFDELVTGRVASIPGIAAREKVTEVYVARLIDLAFLAPGIVQVILDGTQPVDLTTQRLTQHRTLPLDWQEQRQAFGF